MLKKEIWILLSVLLYLLCLDACGMHSHGIKMPPRAGPILWTATLNSEFTCRFAKYNRYYKKNSVMLAYKTHCVVNSLILRLIKGLYCCAAKKREARENKRRENEKNIKMYVVLALLADCYVNTVEDTLLKIDMIKTLILNIRN